MYIHYGDTDFQSFQGCPMCPMMMPRTGDIMDEPEMQRADKYLNKPIPEVVQELKIHTNVEPSNIELDIHPKMDPNNMQINIQPKMDPTNMELNIQPKMGSIIMEPIKLKLQIQPVMDPTTMKLIIQPIMQQQPMMQQPMMPCQKNPSMFQCPVQHKMTSTTTSYYKHHNR